MKAEIALERASTADARRRILALAWPAVVEMTLHTFVWMFDTAMVARLGAVSLSSVGLGAQVYFTLVWVLAGLGTGTLAIVARHWGAGEDREAGRAASQALALAAGVGTAAGTVMYAAAPLVYRAAGLGGEVEALGVQYLRTVSPGAPLYLVAMVANSAMRGTGDTRTPLLIIAVANSINVAGDYLLIFGPWGLPAMGVRGAAVASLLAQVTAGLLATAQLFSRRARVRASLREVLHPGLPVVRRIVRLGVPSGAENLLMDGARTVNMFIVAALGTTSFAAAQVALAAESIAFMPGYGLAVLYLGGGGAARAHGEVLLTLYLAGGVGGAVGVSFLLFPRTLVGVFTREERVASVAAACLWISAFCQPSIAVTEVLTGAFRGAGDTRTPLRITTLGAWCLRVPLSLLAVRLLGLSLEYVWWILNVEWTCRALLAALVFRRGHWKLARV
mgnify:CR=1 FL=1